MFSNNKKKTIDLNIISKTNAHGGFGAGMINLSNVASVMIEDGTAYIDLGALHAKSRLEKGIKFSANKDDVPNGKRCWIVWVASDRNENGPYYAGVTACEMLIDIEARRGWKILADHVNRMDAAMKRRIKVEGLDDTEKKALREFLKENNSTMWENSAEELKQALV